MDILIDREKRADYQKELLANYQDKVLVVIKANYPSNNKNNLETAYLSTKFFFKVKACLKIIDYSATSTNEGLIYYVIVDDKLKETKQLMIALEETNLGRLVDLDVYDYHNQISRADLQIAPRKCFLCEENAKACSRAQRHNLNDLISYFKQEIINDLFSEEKYVNLVIYGLINELNKPYGFGCVGINYQGSHQDMDYKTFIASIEVIANEFRKFENIDTRSFVKLRKFGQSIEKAMFKATSGINTHKGAIFSLILILAGLKNGANYLESSNEIKKLTKDILLDFADETMSDSYGLELYKTTQNKGIRGYAYQGYDFLFNEIETYYTKANDDVKTYLLLISQLEDTTIIKRGGFELLKELQIKAKLALESLSYKELDNFCLNNNLSCGGSADLLACIYVINIVKNNYLKFKE